MGMLIMTIVMMTATCLVMTRTLLSLASFIIIMMLMSIMQDNDEGILFVIRM